MKINLSKFAEEDFDYYFALVSNEEVMAQITERAIPMDEARLNFQKLLEQNEKYEGFGSYKVFNQKIFIGLGLLKLEEDSLDTAEIGYMILPEHWGEGYGTEIAKALILKAEKTGIKKLKAIIDPDNIPSRKILINQGFHSEKICEIGGLPGEILRRTIGDCNS